MRGGWVERGTVLIRLTRPHFVFYRGVLEGSIPAGWRGVTLRRRSAPKMPRAMRAWPYPPLPGFVPSTSWRSLTISCAYLNACLIRDQRDPSAPLAPFSGRSVEVLGHRIFSLLLSIQSNFLIFSWRLHFQQANSGKKAKMIETDVLVVGDGPVGLSLALEFGLQGHRYLLVDLNNQSNVAPRAKCTGRTPASQPEGLRQRWRNP